MINQVRHVEQLNLLYCLGSLHILQICANLQQRQR